VGIVNTIKEVEVRRFANYVAAPNVGNPTMKGRNKRNVQAIEEGKPKKIVCEKQ
jgi:hypothetical protein